MSNNNRPFESQAQQYSDLTAKVYKLFFAPLIKAYKLTIIPDGLLSLVPAEALVKEQLKDRNSFNELDYLIYHHEISYAYSATILYRNTLFESKAINNVLAFSYSSGGSPTLARRRNQQVDLPGTFKELEALSRLFKNVMRFTDQDASKINFVNNTLGHDIIHLGVHGIGDQEVADNSRLIFRNDSLNDAELYAYEIYNLKVDARLVVLSACESGTGRNQAGEGMFSIARAFTYAGCPSLVMSLWQARDAFTSDIMIAFYEGLNKDKSITSSLRNAKLQFLKESDEFTGHPSNWAPFVVNGQDIIFKGNSSHPYWIYIGLIFLVTMIFYRYRRKPVQTNRMQSE
jgi:CHAT domain-containing protein